MAVVVAHAGMRGVSVIMAATTAAAVTVIARDPVPGPDNPFLRYALIKSDTSRVCVVCLGTGKADGA